jgi:hypothetical protein
MVTDMEAIPGWADVVDWFGYSPKFHDAEVVSIDLRRDPEPSKVRVHGWLTNEDITESGHFRQDRHALVTFTIHGTQSVKLDGWNHQNVLSELSVDREDDCYVLRLPEIFGVDGEIAAKQVSVAVEPFEPSLRNGS